MFLVWQYNMGVVHYKDNTRFKIIVYSVEQEVCKSEGSSKLQNGQLDGKSNLKRNTTPNKGRLRRISFTIEKVCRQPDLIK